MSKAEIILKEMLEDVKKHKRDPKLLLNDYVQSRLEKSLQTYYEQLCSSYTSLAAKDEQRILKKLSK